MAIVGGLDIHRRQTTYDWIDTTTGETCRGQLSPASRLELRIWLAQFAGQQAATVHRSANSVLYGRPVGGCRPWVLPGGQRLAR